MEGHYGPRTPDELQTERTRLAIALSGREPCWDRSFTNDADRDAYLDGLAVREQRAVAAGAASDAVSAPLTALGVLSLREQRTSDARRLTLGERRDLVLARGELASHTSTAAEAAWEENTALLTRFFGRPPFTHRVGALPLDFFGLINPGLSDQPRHTDVLARQETRAAFEVLSRLTSPHLAESERQSLIEDVVAAAGGRREDHWKRRVLSVLAQARLSGVPREVVDGHEASLSLNDPDRYEQFEKASKGLGAEAWRTLKTANEDAARDQTFVWARNYLEPNEKLLMWGARFTTERVLLGSVARENIWLLGKLSLHKTFQGDLFGGPGREGELSKWIRGATRIVREGDDDIEKPGVVSIDVIQGIEEPGQKEDQDERDREWASTRRNLADVAARGLHRRLDQVATQLEGGDEGAR